MITIKTLLSTSIALALGGASLSAHSALTTSAVLDFTGTYGLDAGGSTGIILTSIQSGSDGGIHIGVTQDTNGHNSHGGASHNNEGGLDQEWLFNGNSGMHFTTSPITIVDNDVNNDGGFTKTLDFTGWRMTWNAIPSIPLGGGAQDCGTSTDGICVVPGLEPVDIAGTYDNGSGLATITCSTASCSSSSTFTLTYAAVIPMADPSNFDGVPYSLDITGKVNAVPVPAAAWLFGSGLAGLLAVSRRKKEG